MSGYEIRDDEHGIGKVLILKSGWDKDLKTFMTKRNLFALRLTDSFGHKVKNLAFISDLTFLRSLEVYCWDAKNVNVIGSLPKLEVLGLQFLSTQKIDFSDFKNLRVALLTWNKGLIGITEIESIEYLNIQNYPFDSLKPIKKLKKLKKLHLTSRKLKSLDSISRFTELEELDLYNCTELYSMDGIELCPKLEKIEIEACNTLDTQQRH